ncbi:MAG: hypothetical protein WBD99_00050 [Thermodesulfobacteriota bacterium]
MSNPFITFLELTLPFIIGIFALILMFFFSKEGQSNITFTFFNLNYQLPVKSVFAIRFTLLIIAFVLFSVPAFQDYTTFFPSHYEMEVFFDDDGIEKSLKEFSASEIESFNISKNWKYEKMQYFRKLNEDVFKTLGINNFFDLRGGYIYSIGETKVFIEKTKGWQRYYIREASGFLTHYLEKPNEQKRQFNSRFILLSTPDNFIDVTLSDIYFRHTKILRPQFKQMASLTPTGEKILYHHSLITITKVRFFPIIKINNTVYFIRGKDAFHLIPIGYAVYRPI